MKTDFLISNKGQELIKNEEELRVKLSEFVGELPNAAIVDELSNAAKYYTNNGKSNIARYSFRLIYIFIYYCLVIIVMRCVLYRFSRNCLWGNCGFIFFLVIFILNQRAYQILLIFLILAMF